MRIFKYLSRHMGAIVIIFALLIVQAYCDLSLPNYTSDIVDVGIQQKGIEHPALTRISSQTYDDLLIFVSADDRQTFKDAYIQEEDGTYTITQEAQNNIDALDSIESLPEVILSFASESSDVSMDTIRTGFAAGVISDAQINQAKEQITNQMGDMQGTIVKQKAIAFAQTEYESLGEDIGAMQMSYLLRTGGLMVGFTLLLVVASILVGLVASRTAAIIAKTLREQIFRKVVRFSEAEINRFSTASLITRSTNDVQQVQMVCVMLMRIVLYAPVLCIGGLIMIAGTNVSMGWIIALAVVVIVALVILLFSLALPKFKIMQKLIDKLNLVSREILTGISVVRAFGRETHEEARFNGANHDLMQTQLFTNRVMTFMMPAMTLVMNGVSVLIVWTAAGQIDTGAMQVGDMIAFITYSMMIIMSFLMICMISIMLPRAGVAAERIDEVLDTEISISDPKEPADMSAIGAQAGNMRGVLEFDHANFRYTGAEEDVVHDIDFMARPGQTMAIIGSTGCGKSTVLKLIPRFYDVTGGSIRIDGVDIRDMSLADLRKMIGYVPQKSTLFSGSIESNIKFGGDGISDESMREAAQVAQADDFISAKEEGFDEFISQGGTNVSGGQAQRLSIARALATGAPILLFDDSFSALDYETDMKLRAALKHREKTSTVIIVAQRISTVLHADNILVMDEGRIVGRGTHAQLLRDCPLYREIAESQLSAAELEGGGVA